MKDCSSAPIQTLWKVESFVEQPQKPKILGPAACVQILIITVLLHQKKS